MNNRDHCRAVRLLLRQKPHPPLHSYMDAFSKEYGWGHRVFRHNADMMRFRKKHYGADGEREVAFHIACDMGMVTLEDIQ